MSNLKKTQKIFIRICFSILLTLLLTIGVIHADDGPSYSINKLNINCKIEKNGSLQITRTVTYNFDDDAHGLTYQQELPKDDSKYSIQKVEIANGNSHFQNVTKSDSHKNNTYTVSDNGLPDVFLIKTYHKIQSDKQVTIRYIFTMADAVTNYRDAARLNYKVIGFDTNVPQKNVNITFDFGKKNLKLLKAWVHADVNPQKQISAHNGTVNIKVKNLPANDDVEADILFPISITSQNPNVSNHKIIQSTINLEKRIIRDNYIRLFKKYLLIPSIIILYAILRLIIYTFKIKKYNIRSLVDIPHNFEIPTIPVALANAFFTKSDSYLDRYNDDEFYSQALAGELLQLYNQNKVKITHLEKENYSITIIDKKIIEKYNIYDVLFNEIGNGQQFTTSQLNKMITSENKKLTNAINVALKQWYKGYTNIIDKEDVNPQADNVLNNNFLYLCSTFCILGFWWFVFSRNCISLILALIAFGIAFLIVRFTFQNKVPFNNQGLIEYKKIVGFKKMLLDIGNFKDSKLNDLILWKDILPYAVGFGISKKVLDKLTESFTKSEFLETFNNENYFYLYNDFGNTFSSTVSMASTYSSASNSSSSDNDSFSSGDSGGFGGDSGDGAF